MAKEGKKLEKRVTKRVARFSIQRRMTKTDIVSMFKAALVAAGYDDARIRRNYEFSDLIGDTAQLRNIPLVAFSGYPQSYRNACVGVTFADDFGGKPPNQFCALGALLLLTVQGDNVQPWAATVDGVRSLGQSFRLQDTKRVFRERRATWGLAALGRVKKAGDFSSQTGQTFLIQDWQRD